MKTIYTQQEAMNELAVKEAIRQYIKNKTVMDKLKTFDSKKAYSFENLPEYERLMNYLKITHDAIDNYISANREYIERYIDFFGMPTLIKFIEDTMGDMRNRKNKPLNPVAILMNRIKNKTKNKTVMTLHGFMKNFSHDEDLYDNPDFPEHIRNQCFSEALDRFADAICQRQRENFFLYMRDAFKDEELERVKRSRDSLETQPKISDLI